MDFPLHPPYATCAWAHGARTCKNPGETVTVNLLVNTSMHVQDAQHIPAASSSFCFHELGVSGMFGTLQECLGKNVNSTGRQRFGLSTEELGAIFPNPRFAW